VLSVRAKFEWPRYHGRPLGYSQTNRKISPPICTAPCGIDSAHDVAVDNAGNVILAEATGQVSIGQGRRCAERTSQPLPILSGRASTPAAPTRRTVRRGLDAVELSDAGERYRRLYRRGRLHARAYQRLSIHAARRRDRWRRRLLAHAVDVLGQPTLTEFRGCAGSGVVAKGFVNLTLGGIEIDKAGNLSTLDIVGASGSDALDVYRGCNPRCKLVSSNALKNPAYFGHLNANGDRLRSAHSSLDKSTCTATAPKS
jgi:hypothetical protein